MDNIHQIKTKILDWGADLVGIADVKSLDGLKTIPGDLLDPFETAISIAVQLPVSIFQPIIEAPTPGYASVYQTANRLLDDIVFKASRELQKAGYYALPIPASQILDRENWYGAISHKAVARMAGLGWQGKNLLLITPEFGSRVRLATLLVQAPLTVDGPIKNRCGACMNCRDSCPAKAIKGVNTESHYSHRNEALHFDRCMKKLTEEFAKMPEIGGPICGICINACPFGKKIKAPKPTTPDKKD
jgi:epoxyqueuosine reductase